MFAVIKVGGKQYKVAPKDHIVVDKLVGDEGKDLVFSDVLLTSNEKKIKIGTPIVKGVNVTAKIIKQGKGKKIDVRRYKSKVRYRKGMGFRPQITELEIISVG
jgi:large subunit ribosomal protein L21